MRDEPALPRRRPRPVADASVAQLADGVAVAKSWLLALVAAVPLEQAAGVPVGDLAREAPGLAAAILRALGSDDQLDRLGPDGDLAPLAARAGALAGAMDPAGVAAAVESLRACAWHELAVELTAPDAELVADLAGRLAHVCSVVACSALEATAGASAPRVRLDAVGRGAVGVRDLRAVSGPTGDEDDVPPSDADWIARIAARLERHRDGGSFAVLAIEVDDADRLLVAADEGDATSMLARAERAAAGALGPFDELVRERPARFWVTAPGTDAARARVLAERVAQAVAAAAAPHGAALTASVGVAVWPRDGARADVLAARADEGVFAARAAGVPVV